MMTRRKNRVLPLLLALAMLLTLVAGTGFTAFAEEAPQDAPACTHTHNEECGFAEGSEGQPCTHSCELCANAGEDEGKQEGAPALTGTITGFAVMDAVKVALNTPADEVPLPTEVTATVQPEGENAEPATVTVGVGAWSLYFGEYTPEKASMCLYQADAASLVLPEGVSLPKGVSLPENAELPLVRVEVGEFKMEIAPMAATSPTIRPGEKEIYGHGTALVVKQGTSGTTVYIDADGNGEVDPGEQSLHEALISGAPVDDSDLSAWRIFGGGDYGNDCVSNTKITMLSGTVQGLYGGGKFSSLTGNTEVSLKGGTVRGTIFGGGNGAVGSGNGDVTGSTEVTMTGGTVNQYILGSGFGSVSGSSTITITAGEVKHSVYGGGVDIDNAPSSGSTVTLGGTAVIGSASTASTPYGVVINDTDVNNGVGSFALSSPAAGASINVLLSSTPTDGTVIATGATVGNEKYLALVGDGVDGKILYRESTSIKVKAEDRILFFGQGSGFASNSGWGLYTDGGLITEYTGNVGKWAAADGVLTLKGFSHTTAGFTALYIKKCNGLVLAAGTQNSLISTHNGSEETCGLYYQDTKEFTISGQGSLQAAGGDTVGTNKGSYGIFSYASDITIQGSTITATGGESKYSSVGVKVGRNGKVLTIDAAGITANSGNGSGTSANSYGIEAGNTFFENGGELYATSGDVTAMAGTSSGVRSTGVITVNIGLIIAKSGTAPTATAALLCSFDIKPATVSIKGQADPDAGTPSPLVRAADGMYRVDTVDGAVARYAEVRAAGTAPSITTTSLPAGTVGTAYSQTLAATGTAPITWAVTGGTLPEGLTLNSDGTISGTPTVSSTGIFTVTATNSAGSASRQFTIIVWPKDSATKPSITTTLLQVGRVGNAYSETLAATGTAPITWAVTDGTLPEGLTLNSDGAISGTPTAAGDSLFTVTATNTAGSDSRAFSLAVKEADPIDPGNPIDPAPGTPDPNDPEINGSLPLLLMPGADEASIILGIAASNANSYQWYKDGVAISGATGENLTVDKNGGDGQYYVTVTGNGKTLQTNTCTVQWSTNKGSAAVMVMPEPGAPTSVLQNPQAVLDAALTEAEKAELKGDTTAQFIVILQVKPAATESPEATQKAQDEGYTVGGHYDLSLMKMKEGGTSQAGYPMAVTQLNGKIRIQIAIPAEMQAEDRVFAFVRVHNGATTVLEDIDTDPATITIETDQFSPYTLVYKTGATAPPVVKPPVVKPPKATPSPQTGDAGNAGLWALLAVLACGTLGGSLLVLRQGKGRKPAKHGKNAD